MKLSTILVIALAFSPKGNGRITSIGSYSDDFSELEFPDDRADCIDGLCSMYAAKRMIVPEKIVENRQLVPRSYNSADSFSPWTTGCGCVAQYKLVNLGEGHYPRYITTAKCKTKTCSNKFYQCKHFDYRVHILVKRGINSMLKTDDEFNVQDVEELILPESLHANWQLLAISIPVACVAIERS